MGGDENRRMLLITFSDNPEVRKAASAAFEGAKDLITTHLLEEQVLARTGGTMVYDGVIIGAESFSKKNFSKLIETTDWAGKKIGLFALDDKNLEKTKKAFASKNAQVISAVTLKPEGGLPFLKKGELSEGQIARAKAVGERLGRVLTGKRPTQVKEKERISGYKK
ncbi:hypothetical protein HY993_00415 [Candidatus Micrarchaeota archaeon]|nr:hypothetical protein [Candidatus Micrarchaeota archaeon]